MQSLTQPLVPRAAAENYLRQAVPDWEFLLQEIGVQHGWLKFPHTLLDTIRRLKVASYPRLYESELAVYVAAPLAIMGKEDFQALCAEIDAASPDERGTMLQELIDWEPEVLESFALPGSLSAKRKLIKEFRRLPIAEQVKIIKQAQGIVGGFLAILHQTLSIMLHGERLTSLVARAKQDDRDAYLKAIQIDSRIFSSIPFFQQRWNKARLAGEHKFCDDVGRRMAAPPYTGRIKQRSLWMALSALDALGWLTRLSDVELLDLLDDAGVGRLTRSAADIGGLGKCRRQYLQVRDRCVLYLQ